MCDTPELYTENLATLQAVMNNLIDISLVDGVFEVEIKVKVDDVVSWAVIGFGETGNPCVLRFECDPVEPVNPKVHLFPHTINIQDID